MDHVLRAMLSQQLSLRITFPSLSPFLTSRDTCHACEMSDLPSFLISSTTHKNTARTPRLLHFRTTTHYSHHPSGPLHTIHTILQDHYMWPVVPCDLDLTAWLGEPPRTSLICAFSAREVSEDTVSKTSSVCPRKSIVALPPILQLRKLRFGSWSSHS